MYSIYILYTYYILFIIYYWWYVLQVVTVTWTPSEKDGINNSKNLTCTHLFPSHEKQRLPEKTNLHQKHQKKQSKKANYTYSNWWKNNTKNNLFSI